jgi:hypothetical protein
LEMVFDFDGLSTMTSFMCGSVLHDKFWPGKSQAAPVRRIG